MKNENILILANLAEKKMLFFHSKFFKFLLSSIMAGVFCGLGMILAYTSAGSLIYYEATKGLAKLIFGISFALSFTLIIYAGSELFTGSILIMTIGKLEKNLLNLEILKSLFTIYVGNFIGATFIALLIGSSGLLKNSETGNYILLNTSIKMNLSFWESFSRGILCNMLVCLAVWICNKIKSDSAKLIILIWCVYGFCTSGFEHSIANMALFIMAFTSPVKNVNITLLGYLNNIIPVTLGNIVGGCVFVGMVYYFINKE